VGLGVAVCKVFGGQLRDSAHPPPHNLFLQPIAVAQHCYNGGNFVLEYFPLICSPCNHWWGSLSITGIYESSPCYKSRAHWCILLGAAGGRGRLSTRETPPPPPHVEMPQATVSRRVSLFVRSGNLSVLNLLTGQNQHFRPAGATRYTDSREIWHSRETRVRLAVQNFTPIGARRWERGSQNGKNFQFWVKSRPARANPLTDFYTPNYPVLVFYI